MAAKTPSKVGATRDKCVLCGFSFKETFVNEKGKVAPGHSKKRTLSEVSKLNFYAKSDITYECPTAVCVICLALLDKGIKAKETLDTVSGKVALKLSQLPHKGVPIFSPLKLSPLAKRPTATTTTTTRGHSPKVTVKRTITISPVKEVLENIPPSKENMKPKAKRSLSLEPKLSPGQSPIVEVTLTYPSRVIHRQVKNSRLQDIVKAVVLDQIRSASKNITEVGLPGVLQQMCYIVDKEVTILTSGTLNSLLRRTTREDFARLTFQSIFKELKDNAPSLIQLVCSVMDINSMAPTETEMARVCCSLSPMLKTRNQEMSAVAYLTAFVLKHGGCQQEDFERIARMGYSVTPGTAARKLKALSSTMDSEFDDLLNAWKTNASIVKVVENLREVLYARNVLVKPVLDILVSANLMEVKISDQFSSDIHTLTELLGSGFPLDLSTDDYSFQIEGTLTYLNSKYHEAIRSETPTIPLAGDNWDKKILPTFVSFESQGEDLHMFMLVLLIDRLSIPPTLDTKSPQKNVQDLQNEDFLPDKDEQILLRSELSFIVGRSGVSHIPGLKKLFGKTMPKVYPHVFWYQMSSKSEQPVLGLFDINETKTKDMIKLLKILSERFVPTFVSLAGKIEVAEPIFFGGDQLTDERAQGAKRAMGDATTSFKNWMASSRRQKTSTGE